MKLAAIIKAIMDNWELFVQIYEFIMSIKNNEPQPMKAGGALDEAMKATGESPDELAVFIQSYGETK